MHRQMSRTQHDFVGTEFDGHGMHSGSAKQVHATHEDNKFEVLNLYSLKEITTNYLW